MKETKTCLVCNQEAPPEAPTCQYCGEASWPADAPEPSKEED